MPDKIFTVGDKLEVSLEEGALSIDDPLRKSFGCSRWCFVKQNVFLTERRMGNAQARKRIKASDFDYLAKNTNFLTLEVSQL